MRFALIVVVFICIPFPLQGAVFSVNTVAELETALSLCESNGEDDTVNLSAGTYNLTSTLSYDSTEDKFISLQGTNGEVVINGQGNRVLFMRSNASISLNGIIFTNGYAPEGDNGAGVFINITSGDLTMENCQILNSFAAAFFFTNDGGGAYITAGFDANVLIRNCVIAGNSAKGQGGGMYLNVINGTITFVNNTVVNNHNKTSVVEGGGGIYLRLFNDSVVANFYNNILWNNTYAHGNGDLYIENDGDGSGGAAAVFLYNNDYKQLDRNLDENLTFSNNISQDPLLSQDFHLGVSSPCIDNGHAAAPNLATQDFEGDPRNLDGNCDTSSIPDIGADEFYSPPVVTTTPVSGITSTSAASGGNVLQKGGHDVTAKGVCWSTGIEPTLLDTCTDDGTGIGQFASALNGLTENLTYYVRAYATNCEGTVYGEQKSFVATASPTVITMPVTNIDFPIATGGGNVIGEGDAPVTARGVCWSTSASPTLADTCTTDGAGSGLFVSAITGLSDKTTYYVRAYATSTIDTAYGEELSFFSRKKFPWLMFIQRLPKN